MNVDVVREALLADAQADADALVDEADRDARAQVREAQARADELVATAREAGRRDARDRAARQRAAAHREARALVLTARRNALDELRRRARDAARGLAQEKDYADLVSTLRALAEDRLGAGAEVTVDPDGEPGIVASDGHRRIDCRLATLADRAIEGLQDEVRSLWT